MGRGRGEKEQVVVAQDPTNTAGQGPCELDECRPGSSGQPARMRGKRSACWPPWYPLMAASALGIPVGALEDIVLSIVRATFTTLFPAETPSLYPRAAVVTALFIVSRLAIYYVSRFFRLQPRSPSSRPAPRRQAPPLRSRPPLQKSLRRRALWCPSCGKWLNRIQRLPRSSTSFRSVGCARGRRRRFGSELVSKTRRSCFRPRLRNFPFTSIGDFPAATPGGDISKA